MIRNIEYYQNRISLLEKRTKNDNSNIIKKLKRNIRNIQKQNNK